MEGPSSCSCKSIRDDFLQDLFIAMYNNICKEYSINNEKQLKTKRIKPKIYLIEC